jgi:lysophospholipase L1-like esterase
MIGIGLGLTTLRGSSAPAAITFGNITYPSRSTASNAPASRKLAMIGDSRVAGDSPGQFAFETFTACGEWVWADYRDFNYGDGGSTIYNARYTQAPAAVADGCLTFVVLTGTNGAREAGEGDGVDSLANRQTETLGLLAALDQVGATIFLCNEMPGSSVSPFGTDATKLAHHNWINTRTTANTSLSNADLVIVNTWDAVSDGSETTATTLDARWINDGLHPSNRGQERMAQATWTAMNGFFGTDVHLDFASPDQNLCDGTTTESRNRGTMPSGWNDFTAADALEYSVTGTGLDTVFTVENTGETELQMATRKNIGASTDAVILLEYDLQGVVSPASGDRELGPRVSVRNAGLGALYTTAVADTSGTTQKYELGGRRRMVIYIGATAASPRFDLVFAVPGGQTINFYRVDVYER